MPRAGTIPSSKGNTRCHATESPRSTQNVVVGDVPAARVDFLRTTANVLATAAVGLAVLPRPSNAGVFTDDILGFQFEVKCSSSVDRKRRLLYICLSSQFVTKPTNPVMIAQDAELSIYWRALLYCYTI